MLFTVKTITWIALIGINDNGHFRYGTYSVPKKNKNCYCCLLWVIQDQFKCAC